MIQMLVHGNPSSCAQIGRRNALKGLAGSTGLIMALSVVPLPAESAVPDIPEWMLNLLSDRLGRTKFQEGRVHLAMPDRADTGLSVPLVASVPDSPMTGEEHVKSLHVLTTRNPQPLVTDYYFTPRSGIAKVSQRIRLAQSQNVFGFALMSDNSAWMTAKHVSVSLGACAAEIFLPDAQRSRRSK